MGFSALAIADRVGHESIDITYRYYGKQNIMASIADRFPYISGICQDFLSIIIA